MFNVSRMPRVSVLFCSILYSIPFRMHLARFHPARHSHTDNPTIWHYGFITYTRLKLGASMPIKCLYGSVKFAKRSYVTLRLDRFVYFFLPATVVSPPPRDKFLSSLLNWNFISKDLHILLLTHFPPPRRVRILFFMYFLNKFSSNSNL